MESLLPTCCGSTHPASDETAKVSVPPLFGVCASDDDAPSALPDPQELRASAAALRTETATMARAEPGDSVIISLPIKLVENTPAARPPGADPFPSPVILRSRGPGAYLG